MPSSTFSSDLGRRQVQQLHLLYFAAAFLLLCGATSARWLLLPHPRSAILTPATPSRDYYVAIDTLTSYYHFDHMALFHGQYGTLKYLKRADVLFLSNSRLMYGLQREKLDPLFKRLGMNYYMLGFGYGEPDSFPRAIIRKFDLHPKLVVVNADGFFAGTCSPFAKKVERQTVFEARKALFEGAVAQAVLHPLHLVLPHYHQSVEHYGALLLYRSRRTGSWLVPETYPNTYPVPEVSASQVPPLPSGQLEIARQFLQEMQERGTQVVLTFVPAPNSYREHAEQLARSLHVPLISPTLTGMETWDDSHLVPSSAARFSAAFVEELENLLQPRPTRLADSRSPSIGTGPGQTRPEVAERLRKPSFR